MLASRPQNTSCNSRVEWIGALLKIGDGRSVGASPSRRCTGPNCANMPQSSKHGSGLLPTSLPLSVVAWI